ncbi:MAG: hypothetical protein JSU70_09855 [Phycisphaerales bacterium]|nr:MAG: hypothetical protein JSU70_09855 [Phycisphaerales bacterium]
MKTDSILGLDPKRIARLFGITFDSDNQENGNSDEVTAEYLQACLAATVTTDTQVMGGWPGIIRRLRGDNGHDPEQTLGDVLTRPGSKLSTIRKIRRYAKQRASRESSEAERSVAITIYFTAIANALLFHGVKITTHPYESLETSFGMLIAKRWMPAELSELFEKARRACKKMRR